VALIALGAGALVLLLLAGEAFSRARVATIKALLAWVAGLGALSLLALLFLSGRGGAALSVLVFAVPLMLGWWRQARPAVAPGGARRPARPASRMSRAEALQILGLQEGATEAEIRAAWLRMMQTAHPDRGGSDWLAAKVNQARDELLRR
jgi:DnaJ homolog subfamily C member 19